MTIEHRVASPIVEPIVHSIYGPAVLRSPGFIVDIDTTNTNGSSTAANQIKLPLLPTGHYHFTINWGDGSYDTISSYNQAEVTHTYSSGGAYTLTMDGIIRGWGFPDPGRTSEDHTKFTDIKQWGPLQIMSGNEAFHDCINMVVTATDIPDLLFTNDCYRWFDNCESIVTVPTLTSWPFTAYKVTDLGSMFARCSLFNQAIGDMDTGSVTSLRDTFAVCAAFNNGGSADIDNLDVSSCTDLHAIVGFSGSFNQPVGSWDTSACTDLSFAFATCRSFNQDISGWDTSNVTDVNQMFWNASAFKQNLASWDVTSLLDATNFGRGGFDINDPDSATNQDNYDALLNSWAAQAVNSGVPFNMANSKYSAAGAAARNTLVTTYGWTISDGGLA